MNNHQNGYPIDMFRMIFSFRQVELLKSIALNTQPLFEWMYGFFTGIATSTRKVRKEAMSNLEPTPISLVEELLIV